jgi:hypothetical protein
MTEERHVPIRFAERVLNFAPRAPDDASIGELLGQVYEAAPARERASLIEHLIRPLGVLSLLTVANGVFAKLWFRRDLQDLHVRLDDTYLVGKSEIVALADFVQQASVATIDGIADLIATSPGLAASTAAVMLLATLRKRLRSIPQDTAGSGD